MQRSQCVRQAAAASQAEPREGGRLDHFQHHCWEQCPDSDGHRRRLSHAAHRYSHQRRFQGNLIVEFK